MGDNPIPCWPGESVELAGRRVHVRSTPRGPAETAVYIHGLAGSATNWTDLMGELSDVATGYAVDLPGAGHSPEPPDGDYSIDAHARTVAALVEQAADRPVHLFGNSLGGAVAVRLAATRPELVRSLTLVSPALPDLTPRYGPARVALSAVPGLGEWAFDRLRLLPAERRLNATMSLCYADVARVHPERLREAVEELRRRDALPYAGTALLNSARGLVAEYFRRGEDSLWRQAARIQAPTLVIHGRRDRLVNPRMAARAGRTFPRVRLVLLPDAGHVAQMELPKRVAREARRLISETAPVTIGE
ncbi:alpha/beta fold hydrolase [Planobispora longispora]|uniref:Alpha/beta hydrolase n=1 Tax=Planobispora longispora TaxID=28887 RepID=A0A8J3W6D0_9ACTN|nr:alpha/beta fold hydrolase [Planobispora longispora]BFE83372.1 alpha/beta hydrolase [Planobispora longispora]GIH77433.1 alpha/beta hydrolase [Planobispora longispora]